MEAGNGLFDDKTNSELSDQLSWNQFWDSRDRDGLDITLTSVLGPRLGHLKGNGRNIGGNPIVPQTLMLLFWLIREKLRSRTVTLEIALSEPRGEERK